MQDGPLTPTEDIALEGCWDVSRLAFYEAVIVGNRAGFEVAVRDAVKGGIGAARILNEALIEAMSEIGARVEREEFYVPEMLVSARAMQARPALLKPQLVRADAPSAGKIVLGTVKGGLHDIGKNLAGMVLEGVGLEVVDLGVDIAPEQFADAVRMHKPQLLGMLALLTTTMQNMRSTIEALEDMGVRNQVKLIVGGAPVTEALAN